MILLLEPLSLGICSDLVGELAARRLGDRAERLALVDDAERELDLPPPVGRQPRLVGDRDVERGVLALLVAAREEEQHERDAGEDEGRRR